MAIYKNNNKDEKSIFASVDYDDASKTAFFFVKNEVDVEKAKNSLANAGHKVVAQSYVKGHTVIISQGDISKEELFNRISTADGDKFEPVPEEKQTFLQWIKENGWKLRGGSSVVGQSMTLYSAFNTVSAKDAAAGKLTPKFDPATGVFAILNLTANFINYIFGGQQEKDIKGLSKFDEIIADEINHYIPQGEKKLSVEDVRKLSYMTDKEVQGHNEDNSAIGVIKRNSVQLGEVGLRTLGSLALVFNYRKLGAGFKELMKGNVKEAFLTAKTEDKFTFTAGLGMVAGKAMGLAAQTQDPNNPPTTYWGEIRQKVLWITSSFTEMVAQSAFVYDRAKNKKLVINGQPHSDMVGAVGNAILTVPPYPTRLVLPYGKKVLDTDEVQARLLDELHKLPDDKIPEVAARVTARMVEHMGDNSPSFSELYKRLLLKLERFHGVSVLDKCEPSVESEKVGECALTQEKSWAGELADKLANSPKIPDAPPIHDAFAQRIGHKDEKDKILHEKMPHASHVAGLEMANSDLAMARV